MSTYSELIKNFEKIRAYMREFYVYGFKSRDEYNKKSARSYDDERRRMESWLGDHMSFVRTPEGKNVFISIDSRTSCHNPFYKAWKSKSFTDGDITLHFILFDILHAPDVALSLPEIMERIDKDYLSLFDTPMMFDESTVRKKLKEYIDEAIVVTEKQGKKIYYRRADTVALSLDSDALGFFSEVAPCGVVGSFLLDKEEAHEDTVFFKHHYITSAMDSDVLATLFLAMRRKCIVSLTNLSPRSEEPKPFRLIPLRVFISVQNGRQYLLAYHAEFNQITSFRIDHFSDVRLEEPTPRFDELRAMLDETQKFMWGVNVSQKPRDRQLTEHIEFTVAVEPHEDFIIARLEREKRVGRIDKIDDRTYRFSADVYDITETIPWIRTFICRITQLSFSNKMLERRFKQDIRAMYRMYGIGEEEQDDIQ